MRLAPRTCAISVATASILTVLLLVASRSRATADVEQGIALDSQCYRSGRPCDTCPATNNVSFCTGNWVPEGQGPGTCMHTYYFYCSFAKGITCGERRDCDDDTNVLGACGGTFDTCRQDNPS